MSTNRKAIIYSSETGKTEINYSDMPEAEITRRISGYEKKYGKTLKSYARSFSCFQANHEEVFDLQDWETLAEELAGRRPTSKPRNGRKPAYQH